MKNESDLYPYSVADLSSRDALIIAPHPDDESIGCGGSIIRHLKAGRKVKVIFLTDGDRGDFEGRFGDDYKTLRRQSAIRAMDMLGVQDYEFWSYGDRNLYSAEKEIEERLVHVLDIPDKPLVYAPSPYEAHPDHRASFNAVWRLKERVEVNVAVYEVLMALYPNILVDVTAEMEKKKEAIKSYRTELSYNDYIAKVEGLNRFRTATLPANVRYAEAFILLDKTGHRGDADTPALKLLKQFLGNGVFL